MAGCIQKEDVETPHRERGWGREGFQQKVAFKLKQAKRREDNRIRQRTTNGSLKPGGEGKRGLQRNEVERIVNYIVHSWTLIHYVFIAQDS